MIVPIKEQVEDPNCRADIFRADLLEIWRSNYYINEKSYLMRLAENLFKYTDFYTCGNSIFHYNDGIERKRKG